MELMTTKEEYCKVFYYADNRRSNNTILVKISKDGSTKNIEKELIFKNYDEWKASKYFSEKANFNCFNCSYCSNCFYCSNCSYCTDSYECENCYYCNGCSMSDYSSYCSESHHCSDCSYCSHCYYCLKCSYSNNCSCCSRCNYSSYYENNKKE